VADVQNGHYSEGKKSSFQYSLQKRKGRKEEVGSLRANRVKTEGARKGGQEITGGKTGRGMVQTHFHSNLN